MLPLEGRHLRGGHRRRHLRVVHGPLHRKSDRWNRFCELEVEPPEKFITPLSTPDLLPERGVLRRGFASPASEDGARR
jgi:hypothetical protein